MGKEANAQVLFICQGNVGRSQMAEAFYNAMVGERHATSAGIADLAEKYNNHPTTEVITVMQEEGIDISQQQIKQVTQDMVEGVEHVVVLCKDEPPAFVTDSPKTTYELIQDPYQAGIDATREVRDEIKALAERLSRDGFHTKA